MKKSIALVFALALAASQTLLASSYGHFFRISSFTGDCTVSTGLSEPVPAIANKIYPFGTIVKCAGDGVAVLGIDDKNTIRVSNGAIVSPSIDPDNKDGVLVKFIAGKMSVHFDPGTNAPVCAVDSPCGRITGLAGESLFAIVPTPDENVMTAQIGKKGKVSVYGPQYMIPQLTGSVKIATRLDNGYTRITNLAGDYKVYINASNDLIVPVSEDDNANELIWPIKLTVKGCVKIWREAAPGTSKLVASVLATASDGSGRMGFAFTVGDPVIKIRSEVFDKIANKEAIAAGAKPESEEDAELAEELQDEASDEAESPDEGETAESDDESADEGDSSSDDSDFGDLDF